MAKVEIKLSVTDMEPVSELIDIITGFPKEELPESLREQLDTWYSKHYSKDSCDA